MTVGNTRHRMIGHLRVLPTFLRRCSSSMNAPGVELLEWFAREASKSTSYDVYELAGRNDG